MSRAAVILALFTTIAFAEPPPRDGVWQRIQDPLDRSTGRITDPQTHELDRLQIFPTVREFERFQIERERNLRIEQQKRQSPPRTRRELDQREYELFLGGGLSSTSLQAQADEQALMLAKSARDQQIIAATEDRAATLKDRPGDREKIEGEYHKKVREIRARYERERERILGYSPPTTQP